MEPSEYTFLLFAKNDYARYQSLVNNAVGATVPSDVQARRKWWCFDNPSGGAFAVAFAGERVASTCYLAGKSLILNGSKCKAFEIGETATDPAHQRKGLFSKLVKMCVGYAFDMGADVVYGTPNAQSTPGYAKLKFEIIHDEQSNLFVSPNPAGFLFPAPRDDSGTAAIRASSVSPEYRITSSEFFNHSERRPRMNEFTSQYFEWRFEGLGQQRYEFFRCNDFSMAVRRAELGKYKVLMISDYGRSDGKPGTFDAIAEIRKIISKSYGFRSYAGIHFLSGKDSSQGLYRYGFRRLVHHRQLPLCVMTNGNPKLILHFMHCGLPQLSDCDIG